MLTSKSPSKLLSNIPLNEFGEPDFIDGVDNFQKEKYELWQSQESLRLQRLQDAAESRSVERSKWQVVGVSALRDLRKGFDGVDSILGPHQKKKECCLQLLDYVSQLESSRQARKREVVMHENKYYATQLVYFIRKPFMFENRKTDMIRYRWFMMKELRRTLDRSKYFTFGEFSMPKKGGEMKALRIMAKGQQKLVPLDKRELRQLHDDRFRLKGLNEKMVKIQDRLDALDVIALCKSNLHATPSGCPVCGVILMGGVREPIPHVRAINIESGVQTLEKLETELNRLQEMKRDQRLLIQNCEDEILDLEIKMFKLARDNIQAWWVSVLAKWRVRRQERARTKNLYKYRIKRLVRLKRQIDNTIESKMNFEELEYTYSDLIPELKEYVSHVILYRNALGEKIGRIFIDNLRKAVARARRKRYMEDEAKAKEKEIQQALIQKKKRAAELQSMRKLWKTLSKRKYICLREQCNGKTFFSKERYNAHMSIHHIEDVKRIEKINQDKLKQAIKEMEAEEVENRVAIIRDHVNNQIQKDAIDMSKMKENCKYTDPEAADLADISFLEKSSWTSLPHMKVINRDINNRIMHLALISKHKDVVAPPIIPLDKPMVYIGADGNNHNNNNNNILENEIISSNNSADGTDDDNISNSNVEKGKEEVEDTTSKDTRIHIECTGEMANKVIAKTHCIISGGIGADYEQTVTVSDNYTVYGTYIVSSRDVYAIKVTNSMTKGNPLIAGDLLCIGVRKYGAARLEAADASEAYLVYRVHCKSIEEDDD